jgi:hypothetical protein
MAEAFKVNNNVKEIYLDENQIGGMRAKFLAKAIKEKKNFMGAYLNGNNIGN